MLKYQSNDHYKDQHAWVWLVSPGNMAGLPASEIKPECGSAPHVQPTYIRDLHWLPVVARL